MKKSDTIPFAGRRELTPIVHTYDGELGAALDAINDRYSFIMTGRKYAVYDYKEETMRDFETVRMRHSTMVHHNGQNYNPAVLWSTNAHLRRNYDNVVFRPASHINKMDPTHFNEWRGWGVEYCDNMTDADVQYHVEPWLNHIRHVFCSNKEEQYQYFMHWLAHLVQCPEDKPGVAIVVQSGQGFGKGLFTTLLSQIIGRSYVARITDAHHVAGGFSGQLKDKMLINFDEATWGGDKKGNGRLKALITEINLTIEEKHHNPKDIDHYARFFITSNSAYPVPIEHNDRRFFVPDVQSTPLDKDYFLPLVDLLNDSKTASCFFTYLMNMDISHVNIRHFPDSATRQAIKAESLMHNDVYKSFLLAAYHNEIGATQIKTKDLQSSLLYQIFVEWKSQNTFRNHVVSITAFGRAMNEAGFVKHKKVGTMVYNITQKDLEGYLQSIGII